ncbi:MAG TPA: TIGR03364 family FAD-dependent oxidoreductase [Gemmatales bacterium]|nr:TIGR03364 family FAD-dependent oxidoreductase [Gemmatales bacterium]
MTPHYDVAVVGAGILGLAHAYTLAERGQKVAVLERDAQACGASIRNFGMLWPIGQPLGEWHDLARKSCQRWLTLLENSRLWHLRCGSLHLAYHDDEWQVLQEFHAKAQTKGLDLSLLTPSMLLEKYPALVAENLQGGLFSRTEINVDPRQVTRELPRYLQEVHHVDFYWSTRVTGFDLPQIDTTRGKLQTDRLILCTGVDFRELLPEAFANSGIIPCKLQMMRTQPYGASFQLGTMMAGGLTLRHYRAFQICPSLPRLVERLEREYSEYTRLGIHVMVAQNATGEIILGDSHEYGDDIDPFDKTQIEELILRYLDKMIRLPEMRIAARWHGIYAKHPTMPYVIAQPNDRVLAVTGVGGAGMTLSMGLADRLVQTWL